MTIGEGDAVVDGNRLAGDEALTRRGLEPVDLQAKEGLTFINETQLTVGLAALMIRNAERTVRAADAVGRSRVRRPPTPPDAGPPGRSRPISLDLR